MFYVYLLQDVTSKKLYIGYTSNLKRRIEEHRSGTEHSTKRGNYRLIFYEAYQDKRDALIRETRLKQFKKGYSDLKRRLQYSLS